MVRTLFLGAILLSLNLAAQNKKSPIDKFRQLEEILGVRLFGRADFSLTTEGSEYLAQVREGLAALERFPGKDVPQGKRKLKVAVTPTFAR